MMACCELMTKFVPVLAGVTKASIFFPFYSSVRKSAELQPEPHYRKTVGQRLSLIISIHVNYGHEGKQAHMSKHHHKALNSSEVDR